VLLPVLVDVLHPLLTGQFLSLDNLREAILALSAHCFPLLPVKRNRTSDPSAATWRFLSLVSP
jgi:hypothetical protein